jgi:hypothetical protein
MAALQAQLVQMAQQEIQRLAEAKLAEELQRCFAVSPELPDLVRLPAYADFHD